ncbi:complement resistance protein TraT [Legionella busanensis]|nr:complement resistance protein TraT [Legionella busanensis]
MVSNADKVKLKFQDARPLLEQGLVKVIAGIF